MDHTDNVQVLMDQPLPAYKYVILGFEGENHNEISTCQMFEYGYEGWLNSTAINTSYVEETKMKKKPIDCMWTVNVTENWKVSEEFLWFYQVVNKHNCYVRIGVIFY